MSKPTTLEINVSAYIRRIHNPEKKRYATDYVHAWLLGSPYPSAEDYDLSAMGSQAVQIQMVEIFNRYGRRNHVSTGITTGEGS